jgi:hypothetical protein
MLSQHLWDAHNFYPSFSWWNVLNLLIYKCSTILTSLQWNNLFFCGAAFDLLHLILLRIFISMFTKDIGLVFFCYCCVLVWFWEQRNTGFIEWLWKVSSMSILWDCLGRIGISSLKFHGIHQWSHPVHGFSLLRDFYYWSISLDTWYWYTQAFYVLMVQFARSYVFRHVFISSKFPSLLVYTVSCNP